MLVTGNFSPVQTDLIEGWRELPELASMNGLVKPVAHRVNVAVTLAGETVHLAWFGSTAEAIAAARDLQRIAPQK